MAVVVPDLFRDPVIDGLHLLIGGLGIQSQLRPHGTIDIVAQPFFLCSRGVPNGVGVFLIRLVGNVVLVLSSFFTIGKAVGDATVLPEQIVTGGAAASYVILCLIPKICGYLPMVAGGRSAHTDLNAIASGDHLTAQHLDSLRLGQIRRIGRRLNIRRPLC